VSTIIVPPFTDPEQATRKVQIAEDLWNTRDPERVAAAYTEDTQWRNRTEFLNGRQAVVEFLRRKWNRELDYRLKKELWGFRDNRMAVKFQYEWHDESGQWFRSYGRVISLLLFLFDCSQGPAPSGRASSDALMEAARSR